jgi:heme A synthase
MTGGASPRAYRRLAWSAAAATFALITLGGVVRITGSGLGCGDDWPLCHGRLIPPFDLSTLIEYGHRLAASLVSLVVLGLLALAWTRHRGEPRLRRPATLAALLLLFQVLLGAITVWLRLPAASVVLHLTTAMVLLAVLVEAALRAEPGAPPVTGVDLRSAALGRALAALGFVTLVAGGLVANLQAGPACQGFPLCNGALLPAAQVPVVAHWAHRVLAFTLLALLGAAFAHARRSAAGVDARLTRRVRRLSAAALVLAAAQIGVAAAMILLHLPPILRGLHLALGTLLWITLVALAHACPRAAREREEPSRVRPSSGAAPTSSPSDRPRRARRADVTA